MNLKISMTGDPVWARVMRPRIPLVYLDLNHIIGIAKVLTGHPKALPDYGALYEAALRAKNDRRAVFPLSGAHFWEVIKISDPKQRVALAEVLESVSDFQYLLGRVEIAQLELEAGIEAALGESDLGHDFPLLRPTFGQAFGLVGGLKIHNGDGSDGTDAMRTKVGAAEFDVLMARMNGELERSMLRGPSDDEAALLRSDDSYRPQEVLKGHQSRLAWEIQLSDVLVKDPTWRRNGRLRDVVGAREFVHEWLDLLNRIQEERHQDGRTRFDPTDEEMQNLLGNCPPIEVAAT